VPAAPIVKEMRFFPLQQLAVAACSSGGSVLHLWPLFLQVATPTPETTGWLFDVYPDVAELLAVVSLRESALSSICLYPESNVAEAWQI
jgi:hypothetical protein